MTTRRVILKGLTATLLVGCVPGEEPSTGTFTDTGDAFDDESDETEEPDDSGTVGDECDLTDEDIEGPFYREDVPIRSNLDLYNEDAQRLTFDGQITDEACAPLEGAVVEIWHADAAGGYDNDTIEHRYRGQVATDADGRYQFQTIVPGRYLNGAEYRPAHIHLKVWVNGQERLTTQLYFANDPYNENDSWFDVARIVADLNDGDEIVGTMNITV
ncbi:MAG: hypothetical protein AAFV53_00125 [Myxococcota bacterium]